MQKVDSLKINPKRLLLLSNSFGEKEADKIVARLFELGKTPTQNIFLQMNSKGGGYVAGMKIYDAIQQCEANVTGIVIGDAFSMTSIILQACSYRIASQNSRLLFHHAYRDISIRIEANVKVEDFRIRLQKEIDDLNKKNAVIKKIIEEKILSDEDLDLFLKQDKIITPAEALNYNLIDKII